MIGYNALRIKYRPSNYMPLYWSKTIKKSMESTTLTNKIIKDLIGMGMSNLVSDSIA